jgi:hypothetical protein
MSSRGFAARAQSAGDRNANVNTSTNRGGSGASGGNQLGNISTGKKS